MLSRNDVFSIWLNLAKTFPYTKRKTIETFYEVNSIPNDYNSESLGKTYQDYLDGKLWNRDWIDAGSPKGQFKFKYPVLGMEQKFQKISASCNDRKGEMTFNISLVDQVIRDCDCERSESMVYSDLIESLTSLWEEFKTYQKAETNDGDFIWLSTANIDYIKNNPNHFDFNLVNSRCLIETCLMVQGEEITIYPIDKSFLNNGIGIGLSFTLRNCVNKADDFNYKPASKIASAKGFPACSSC